MIAFPGRFIDFYSLFLYSFIFTALSGSISPSPSISINFNMALAGLLIVEFQRIINLDFSDDPDLH